ncbi:MAG: tryptophan synthase subunit alpha [Planctomycetota bacterium]
MSRISTIFQSLHANGRTGLMPFITAGYPSLDVTLQTLPLLEAAGASIVEIGIPFSDPIADGPVIASSMHEALISGITPARIFEGIARVRHETTLGLLGMVSYSIIRRMDDSAFVNACADAGFDGLIVPDIDLDDAATLRDLASERGLSFTCLVAPTSSSERIEKIVRACTGFVYVLARTGITGEQNDSPEIEGVVERVRAATDLPIAVGFGVSTADHVAAVTRHADAAIVGSALVRRMGESDDPVGAARDFVSQLVRGLQPAQTV